MIEADESWIRQGRSIRNRGGCWPALRLPWLCSCAGRPAGLFIRPDQTYRDEKNNHAQYLYYLLSGVKGLSALGTHLHPEYSSFVYMLTHHSPFIHLLPRSALAGTTYYESMIIAPQAYLQAKQHQLYIGLFNFSS